MIDEEAPIDARSVLRDTNRLALDGYHARLKIIPENNRMALSLTLDDGQRRLTQLPVLETEHSVAALADATRELSLLDAIANFLNTYGDPKRVLEIAQKVATLPRLNSSQFEFMFAMDQVDRENYYRDTDGKLHCALSGAMTVEAVPDAIKSYIETFMLDATEVVKDITV